jgi:hypothetical protein
MTTSPTHSAELGTELVLEALAKPSYPEAAVCQRKFHWTSALLHFFQGRFKPVNSKHFYRKQKQGPKSSPVEYNRIYNEALPFISNLVLRTLLPAVLIRCGQIHIDNISKTQITGRKIFRYINLSLSTPWRRMGDLRLAPSSLYLLRDGGEG